MPVPPEVKVQKFVEKDWGLGFIAAVWGLLGSLSVAMDLGCRGGNFCSTSVIMLRRR
ncbi:hypothetical protein J6590_068394 [Homalodisca vitripennis]|nr:hypothetical protein J6590_068394 [Homalodisca vitripennis]